jgi:hypothetical protein
VSDRWTPTGGKIPNLDDLLNQGQFKGKPIYIHVTSNEGWQGIAKSGKINATPKKARRGNSAKNGIYLNPCSQAFWPEDAWTLLFFCEQKYRDSADYCLVFSFLNDIVIEANPISEASWVKEMIYWSNISLNDITLHYSGPNPFIEMAKQNHEMSSWFG